MNKSKLESFIGKMVAVTIYPNEEIIGVLQKTGDEKYKDDPNFYIPCNYYFLDNPKSFIFRSSHVRKIREV